MSLTIRWKAEYEIGVAEIDRQHQQLVANINQLVEMVGAKVKQEELEEVLDDLFDYFEFHFCAEEKLLRHHPEIALHRQQHAQFVEEIKRLNRDFLGSNSDDLAREMLRFLASWLLSHVLGTDKIFFAGYQESPSSS